MKSGTGKSSRPGPLLLGVDTGGTFTDFVLYDGAALRLHKRLSTPHAPEEAILAGIAEMGLDPRRIALIHGSTVATNAALEGKGVRTAYIADRGLADVLTIGRQARAELYELQPAAQPPPVPPELCLETGGRLGADGAVVEHLTAADLAQLRAELVRLAPRAVAINLLFSFLDPRHEEAVAAAVPDGIFVSRSSEVLPEYREYERGIATWLNAWVGPLVEDYLTRLRAALPAGRVSVMQSHGGTIDAAHAGRQAVRMLLSGPAGGLAGARHVGDRAGCPRLLTFDMGGTSTDVALIDGGIRLTGEGRIGPWPVAVPMVDMHTIGAGGGSLAWRDGGGLLQVGPRSAGAQPGPACYGRGGTGPTVTDANLILGRLRPDAFLGGAMRLDPDAARAALAPLARDLGLGIEDTAAGIVKVADERMTQALRVISVQRGIDPRDYTLMSFGGAGGLHVCALAEAMGMRRALVPVHAGVLSALGMLAAPRARQLSRTLARALAGLRQEEIERGLADLAAQGRAALREEGVGAMDCEASLDLRYRGQSATLNLPWRGRAGLEAEFHAAHRSRYGHELARAIELVNLRVGVQGRIGAALELPRWQATSAGPDTDGAGIHRRAALPPGARLHGPALILEQAATTYLAAGWSATVDDWGNLMLERGGA